MNFSIASADLHDAARAGAGDLNLLPFPRFFLSADQRTAHGSRLKNVVIHGFMNFRARRRAVRAAARYVATEEAA